MVARLHNPFSYENTKLEQYVEMEQCALQAIVRPAK